MRAETFSKRSTPKIVEEEVCDCLGRGPVYASVDIDVLDPAFVPATGHATADFSSGTSATKTFENCPGLVENNVDHLGPPSAKIRSAVTSGQPVALSWYFRASSFSMYLPEATYALPASRAGSSASSRISHRSGRFSPSTRANVVREGDAGS
ncbi:arginase family protein [Nocardioides ochotonae]|uniref:arginase family protein n=1 Tax=Nocardioides ochotonae TaxID=2685869 RepID=UPI003C7CBB58